MSENGQTAATDWEQRARELLSEWGTFIAGDGHLSIGKLDESERIAKAVAALAEAARPGQELRARVEEALRGFQPTVAGGVHVVHELRAALEDPR